MARLFVDGAESESESKKMRQNKVKMRIQADVNHDVRQAAYYCVTVRQSHEIKSEREKCFPSCSRLVSDAREFFIRNKIDASILRSTVRQRQFECGANKALPRRHRVAIDLSLRVRALQVGRIKRASSSPGK